jgi:hypothetical protein
LRERRKVLALVVCGHYDQRFVHYRKSPDNRLPSRQKQAVFWVWGMDKNGRRGAETQRRRGDGKKLMEKPRQIFVKGTCFLKYNGSIAGMNCCLKKFFFHCVSAPLRL